MAYGGPSKRQSPWFYVGIGCATLLLVSLVGCVALVSVGVNRFQALSKQVMKEAETPVTAAELVKAFKEVPFYPKAAVNTDKDFRTMRATVRILQASHLFDDVQVALLSTSDPPEKVTEYYRKQLEAVGYTETSGTATQSNDPSQITTEFKNGRNLVMLSMLKPTPDSSSHKTVITLVRYENVQQGFHSSGLPQTPGE